MYSRKYIRSSLSAPSAIGRNERGIPLPPNYTGTVFSQDRRQDFPEAFIPERPAPIEGFTVGEAAEPTAEPIALPLAEEGFASAPVEREQSSVSDEEDAASQADCVCAPEWEEPAPFADEAPPTSEEDAEASPELREPAPAEQQSEPPLLTLNLLRSLTLEDLLLFWMLLMLLTCSQEDQIYLLLGLLLFCR